MEDVVAAKKPVADIYRLVPNELKLEGSHCLAIGDSRNGLEAALGADIPTLITRNIYTKHQSFEDALRVVDTLPQLNVGGARTVSAEDDSSLLSQIKMLHFGQ